MTTRYEDWADDYAARTHHKTRQQAKEHSRIRAKRAARHAEHVQSLTVTTNQTKKTR